VSPRQAELVTRISAETVQRYTGKPSPFDLGDTVSRPRTSPPAPPKSAQPGPQAAAIIASIYALVRGTGEHVGRTAAERGLDAHFINHHAALAFAEALDNEKEEPGTTWALMHERHGMAASSLEWRVYGRRGTLPERWRPGVRKGRRT
jgi:hypothetical protein